MTQDRFIDTDIRSRIEHELDQVECDHGVTIIAAVESGSRAWRFPSQDSDYDVRFVYLQPIERYLSVNPHRDVIERPIDAVFDVNGWDLRKAFQLAIRSNAVLIEWLCSPVRYRTVGTAAARLLDFARANADLRALAYHYDHQSRSSFETILADGDAVRLKTYCYALRPALALSWLRRFREVPPMDLPALMAGLELAENVTASVADVLARKFVASEQDRSKRIGCLDRLIADILAEPITPVPSPTRQEVEEQADTLFASIVLESRSNTK